MTLPLTYQICHSTAACRQGSRSVHLSTLLYLLKVFTIFRIVWYSFINTGIIKICTKICYSEGKGGRSNHCWSQVLTAFSTKNVISCDVTPCSCRLLTLQENTRVLAPFPRSKNNACFLFLLVARLTLLPWRCRHRPSEKYVSFYVTALRYFLENTTLLKPLFMQMLLRSCFSKCCATIV